MCGQSARDSALGQWLRSALALACLLGGFAGCSRPGPASSEPSPVTAHEASSSGGEAPALSPDGRAGPRPVRMTLAELTGTWVEFWSPAGSADTQRYLFGADGSYRFTPAAGADATDGLVTGRFELHGATLTLLPAGAQPRQLELAACPANREAEQLDSRYRCVSFGGRTFWKRF